MKHIAIASLAPLALLLHASTPLLHAGERDRDPATTVALEQRQAAIADGRLLYRGHCQNCHGAGGKGDGPMASLLRVAPADLTQVRRHHDGRFPAAELQLVIDGRKEVRGHGSREMPIWGLSLTPRGDDSVPAAVVEQPIRNLVAFLESIQAEPRRRSGQ